MPIKNNCIDRTLISTGPKGPRPLKAFQITSRETSSKEVLTPSLPKRTTAHSSNGRTRYMRGATPYVDPATPKKTPTTSTIAAANRTASRHLLRDVVSGRCTELSTTTVGTIATLASMLERKRSLQSGQKLCPNPVRTTTPISRKEVRNGANTTPSNKKHVSPLVDLNSL